jgi:hypothetical protein
MSLSGEAKRFNDSARAIAYDNPSVSKRALNVLLRFGYKLSSQAGLTRPKKCVILLQSAVERLRYPLYYVLLEYVCLC